MVWLGASHPHMYQREERGRINSIRITAYCIFRYQRARNGLKAHPIYAQSH